VFKVGNSKICELDVRTNKVKIHAIANEKIIPKYSQYVCLEESILIAGGVENC
jgi:hypothetical protein